MDFAEFIDAFGTGYAMIFDYETNMKLNKPFFCRYLICSITKDGTIVMYINGIKDKAHERGESAFQAFYRNKDRRSLHPIAESIVNSNSLDTRRFMLFLEEYCKDYSKEKLLTNFKKYLSSTTSSTLFEDITNEFVRILRVEADSFILSKHQFMIESIQNYHIHRLSDLLKEAKSHF